MKQAFVTISRILMCVLCGGFMGASVYAQTNSAADSCPEPPSVIHLHYQFDWQPLDQKRLMGEFKLKCGLPSDVDWLVGMTATALNKQNVQVIGSQLSMKDDYGQVSIRLQTDKDDGQPRSVLFPVKYLEKDNKIFSYSEVTGVLREDQTLVLRYVVDDGRVRDPNSEIMVQWLRNDKIVRGATKSRYKLTAADVGTQIAVRLTMLDSRGEVQAENVVRKDGLIAMVVSPPEIRNLQIVGDAVVGKLLSLSYDYSDRNPTDAEENSEIIWLRDGYVIKGGSGPSYQIVPQDVGKRLSVQITPRNVRGETGKTSLASMQRAVEDELITLRPDILAGVEATENAEQPFEALAPELTPLDDTAQDDIQLVSDDDRAREGASINLTRGLQLSDLSPRQFTGLDLDKNDLLPQHVVDDIEAKMIGQEISLGSIKAVIEAVNEAFREEEFELSRALLPEQIITDGRLKLQLVQTTIGQIKIEDRDRMTESFVYNHLGLNEGDYISLAQLERSIRLFNAGNKSKLTTELAPGENFGETDIFVQVNEPDAIELPSFSVDNYANEVSDWRNNSATVLFNNLLGKDDETTVTYSDSGGSNSYSVLLSMPLSYKGTNFSASYAGSETKTVSGNPDTVGYRGTSNSFSLALSHPIIFEDQYSVYLSGSYGQSFNDLTQPISGDLLSESRGRKLTLSMPFSYSNGLTTVSVAPNWHIINTVTAIPPLEVWVQKFDGDVSVSQYLNERWTANLRGKFLYTRSRHMLNMPGEILSVGGPSSVRAYQPSESSGYQGYFVSGEFRTDLANWETIELPDYAPNIQPYIFVDHMLAHSQYKKSTRADYWSGYGAGVSIPSIFDVFSFDAYWSEPLDGAVHEAEKEAYDDQLIQFSLNARIPLQSKDE